MLKAVEMYSPVSSSPACDPGCIHGMLTINARTISTERYLLAII